MGEMHDLSGAIPVEAPTVSAHLVAPKLFRQRDGQRLDTLRARPSRGGEVPKNLRLFVAIQLCSVRLYGRFLNQVHDLSLHIVDYLGQQLDLPPSLATDVPERKATYTDQYVMEICREIRNAHEKKHREIRKRQKRAIDVMLDTAVFLLDWPDDQLLSKNDLWRQVEEVKLRSSRKDLQEFKRLEERGYDDLLLNRYPSLRKYF